MIDQNKKKFIDDELLTLVSYATLQRSNTYNDEATDKCRADFRQALKKELKKLAETYSRRVTDEEHIANIESLSNAMTKEFKDYLADGCFRIGSAQKALNLYLKYLWCIGQIRRPPPQCPLDNKIIRKLGADVKWTEMKKIRQYKNLMKKARKVAGDNGIAEWELIEYNKDC